MMPTVFLEGFKELEKLSESSFLPKNKKTIFTTSIHEENIFKFWVSDSISRGSKLVLYQHGGNYGSEKCLTFEKHEIKICDRFLTWV